MAHYSMSWGSTPSAANNSWKACVRTGDSVPPAARGSAFPIGMARPHPPQRSQRPQKRNVTSHPDAIARKAAGGHIRRLGMRLEMRPEGIESAHDKSATRNKVKWEFTATIHKAHDTCEERECLSVTHSLKEMIRKTPSKATSGQAPVAESPLR